LIQQHQQQHGLLLCLLADVTDDFLFLAARLVAYWPVPIHAVASAAYTVLTWLLARQAVCYSQRRSIFSSATAFPTATLHRQQSRYRTINRKKL